MKTNDEIVSAVDDALSGFGGFLRCESCGYWNALDDRDIAAYLSLGWPKCCGQTMRWWTARQVAANEVPDLGAR